MSYIVAVDSGGTFTDACVVDATGTVTRAKAPSTPPDFEAGVLNSVTEAAKRLDKTLAELLAQTRLFAHGTTVATNILITRTGARTALLTTRGHEDAIIIGRTMQKVAGLTEAEVISVAELAKADPIVPRARIFGVDERVDRSGNVVVSMQGGRFLDALGERLEEEGVEAVALCLLWSFLNPEHEQQLRDWLERRAVTNGNQHAKWIVTASSELVPVVREYERTATTVLNAYLTPGVYSYLERMGQGLRDVGYTGSVTVMHSAGGMFSVEEARQRAVTLLSSGPVGGMLGTKSLAERLGLKDVLATDVGGTSFDVGAIVDGEPGYAPKPVFGRYPIALPVIDITSIGAGGGSIAWIEPETGVLKVGPQSAAARPGPVCYGAGGTQPTVTDANLALGRLNPGNFLGGRLKLQAELAQEAIRTQIADPLGMSVSDAAAAIVDIADAHMSDLIRRVTVERGHDPSRFTVFAYGGAGGLHAGAYSRALGCQGVVVPRAASVFSAFGISASDIKHVIVASDPMRAPFDMSSWREQFATLESELVERMRRQQLPIDRLETSRSVDLQFRGQVHAIRVPIQDQDLGHEDQGESVIDRFVELYEAKYGRDTAYRKAGVEAMTFVVEGVGRLDIPVPDPLPLDQREATDAQCGDRLVYFRELGGFEMVGIYEAERLHPGWEVNGPALIEAEDTTVVVHPGQRLWVDGFVNMRLDLDS
jgi:N-methylhydantoinase A